MPKTKNCNFETILAKANSFRNTILEKEKTVKGLHDSFKRLDQSKGPVKCMISPRGELTPCLQSNYSKWLHVAGGVKFHPGLISPLS